MIVNCVALLHSACLNVLQLLIRWQADCCHAICVTLSGEVQYKYHSITFENDLVKPVAPRTSSSSSATIYNDLCFSQNSSSTAKPKSISRQMAPTANGHITKRGSLKTRCDGKRLKKREDIQKCEEIFTSEKHCKKNAWAGKCFDTVKERGSC